VRGSCETRFFSHTLRRKVNAKNGGDSAGLFLVHKLPLGDERPNEEKMAADGLAAILAFFGVDPKKVPPVMLRQSALLPTG
jgi:hypothetical protein